MLVFNAKDAKFYAKNARKNEVLRMERNVRVSF